MIRSLLRMTVQGREKDEVMALFRGLIGPTRAESGCQDCCLCEDVSSPGRICFSAKWINRPALDRHVRSDAYHSVLTAMELASGPPEVCFEEIGAMQGMDYISSVLTQDETSGESG